MAFYEYFEDILSEKLEKRDTLDNVLERVQIASKNGRVAFFPASRLSSIILHEIKERSPEIIPRVIGCFSPTKNATTEEGFNVYPARELDDINDISLLVIASNTFKSKEELALKKLTRYDGETLKTSFFHISLPSNISNKEILKKVKRVYDALGDDKSRATYMNAWLSRMLDDEVLTHAFQAEQNIDETLEPFVYHGHKIKGLDHTCKKELQSELYLMKEVFPQEGEIVLDLGAYKGDTAIFFADRVGRDGKVYAFEPVKPNLDVLIENSRANNFGNVIVPINAGVSSRSGKMKVISDAGGIGMPWSFLDEKRGSEIDIVSLDDFVRSQKIKRVDYIKMDIEGFEEEAIEGAKETIATLRPKMAIAAYHKTTDLFTIPEAINSIADYQVFMRSKVEGPFGFTFYFKPRQK